MNKIVEALKKLLPEENLKEVVSAVEEMLTEAKKEIEEAKEAEFNKKLEEAYAEISSELAEAERIGEQGYEEALAIITDLRERLEIQREEFERTLEEGYNEAYEMILAERAKNNSIEVTLYEEYDKKYKDQREYFVDMIDKFFMHKGPEIAEQVRRDILNDPRTLEYKVAMDKIVEIVSNYLDDEERALATSSKLEEAYKVIEELKGQLKLTEARNIRLSTEKTKLEEAIKHNQDLISESRKINKNERVEKAKNVSGRGRLVTEEETKVIAEYNNDPSNANKDTNKAAVLAESLGVKNLDELKTLAGTKTNK